MAEALKSISENADKLGSVGTLLVVLVGFIWALSKDYLVTGSRYRETKASEAEYKAAAKAAIAELDMVRISLTRLQTEKEYGWQPRIKRRSRE